MVANAKRDQPHILDLESLVASPCKSKDDVILLLGGVLHELGGDMDGEDEPGLSPSSRRIEDALRTAIKALIAMGGLAMMRHSRMAYLIPPDDWIRNFFS